MREFYFNLLQNLDKLAGLKQLEKMKVLHGEDEKGLKSEINILLDVLCRVSSQFPFIPNHEQEKIINQAVISEQFNSLNANTIYHWLAKHKDKYFKESHHVKPEEVAKPLTGEARQKRLDEWMKSLAAFNANIVNNSKIEYEEEGKEWASQLEKKAVSTQPDPERKVYNGETLKERNERIRVMQEKAFRDRNPGASEEEVKLFMENAKRYEVKIQ